jgi:uncharacterized membrane protein
MIPGSRSVRRAALAGALVSALVLTACGSTADNANTPAAGAGGVKTD